VPIPLSSKRYRERGYNHAEVIASYVAKYFKLVMNSKLLIRVKDTKPQYKLSRKERFENIRGAFDTIREKKIPRSIVLIDDVATTFSTLQEAAMVLKQSGVKKVLGVTFAREA
jgi:ComF family protein